MNLKRIPVKGLLNCRDLGGYPAEGGKATKWKTIFRTDGLFQLEISDIKQIAEYCCPGMVIDLRGQKEQELRPNLFEKMEGISFVNVPLIAEERGLDVIIEEWNRLDTAYNSLIAHSKGRIKIVFESISKCLPKPVMINCTAGKDRTGVISGLILALCGVSYSDIIADYEVSSTYIKMKLEKVVEPGIEINMEHVASPADIMKGLLDFIDEEYGSVRKYLNSCNIDDATLNNIKCCMLENLGW